MPAADITEQQDPPPEEVVQEKDELLRQDALKCNSRGKEEGIRTRAGRRVKPPAPRKIIKIQATDCRNYIQFLGSPHPGIGEIPEYPVKNCLSESIKRKLMNNSLSETTIHNKKSHIITYFGTDTLI